MRASSRFMLLVSIAASVFLINMSSANTGVYISPQQILQGSQAGITYAHGGLPQPSLCSIGNYCFQMIVYIPPANAFYDDFQGTNGCQNMLNYWWNQGNNGGKNEGLPPVGTPGTYQYPPFDYAALLSPATQVCSPSVGSGTCTNSWSSDPTMLADRQQYEFCGAFQQYHPYVTGGGYWTQPHADAASYLSIVSPDWITGTVSAVPPAVVPGASVNVSTTLSNLFGESSGTLQKQLTFVLDTNTMAGCPQPHFTGCDFFGCTTGGINYNPGSGYFYSCGLSGATTGGGSFGPTEANCNQAGTVCTGFMLTNASLSNTIAPGTYNVCVYFNTSTTACDNTNTIFIGNQLITVGPQEPGYGLSLTTKPVITTLGNTTFSVMSTSAGYYSTTVTANPQPICAPGDTCYTEFAGPLQNGCKDPRTLPNCNPDFSSTQGWGQTVPLNYPCILNQFQGYQNSNNITYTEPINTQYLPQTNYLMCSYDYQTYSQLNNQQFSEFFATAVLVCQGNQCTTLSNPPQFILAPCAVSPTGLTCGVTSTTGNFIGVSQANVLGPFQQAACGVYDSINIIFLIFALILISVGTILYTGSHVLPGQQQGQLKGYSMGFIIVGVIALIIISVSLFLLALVGGTSVQNVLALCA